jgi:hypothetical protein
MYQGCHPLETQTREVIDIADSPHVLREISLSSNGLSLVSNPPSASCQFHHSFFPPAATSTVQATKKTKH